MRFAYYDGLTARSKRTYNKSDRIERIAMPDIGALVPLARAVAPALEAADRAAVERASQALVDAINHRMGTPPVEVRVLERRPANNVLRTLVREVVHHLDYEHYKLEETFHTQGFYTRESTLMKELLGEIRPPE